MISSFQLFQVKSTARHHNAVLYIPGHKGSYRQIEPLARVLVESELFSIHFNEESTAFDGNLMWSQAHFVCICIQTIGRLVPWISQLILVAHSMGGIVLRGSATLSDCFPQDFPVNILTLSSPHNGHPLAQHTFAIEQFYDTVNSFWKNPEKWSGSLAQVVMISLSGGNRDQLIRTELTEIQDFVPRERGIQSSTASVPFVWTEYDHIEIVQCLRIIKRIQGWIHQLDKRHSSVTDRFAIGYRFFGAHGAEQWNKTTYDISEQTNLKVLDTIEKCYGISSGRVGIVVVSSKLDLQASTCTASDCDATTCLTRTMGYIPHQVEGERRDDLQVLMHSGGSIRIDGSANQFVLFGFAIQLQNSILSSTEALNWEIAFENSLAVVSKWEQSSIFSWKFHTTDSSEIPRFSPVLMIKGDGVAITRALTASITIACQSDSPSTLTVILLHDPQQSFTFVRSIDWSDTLHEWIRQHWVLILQTALSLVLLLAHLDLIRSLGVCCSCVLPVLYQRNLLETLIHLSLLGVLTGSLLSIMYGIVFLLSKIGRHIRCPTRSIRYALLVVVLMYPHVTLLISWVAFTMKKLNGIQYQVSLIYLALLIPQVTYVISTFELLEHGWLSTSVGGLSQTLLTLDGWILLIVHAYLWKSQTSVVEHVYIKYVDVIVAVLLPIVASNQLYRMQRFVVISILVRLYDRKKFQLVEKNNVKVV